MSLDYTPSESEIKTLEGLSSLMGQRFPILRKEEIRRLSDKVLIDIREGRANPIYEALVSYNQRVNPPKD